MKNIVIIPARGGSKRLPGKNLLPLGGIPLIVHSILFAQQNNSVVSDIFVSTDDEGIKEVSLQYGVKVINRPTSLSGDFEPTITAVQHALENISSVVDNVILLQPTNPLRPENLLEEAFEMYQRKNCESLFTVTRNHQKLGKIIENQFSPFNYTIGQRSQDLDPLYFENGLLYIIRANLIRKGYIISENSMPYEVDHVFANLDIDTQEDLDYANFLIKKNER